MSSRSSAAAVALAVRCSHKLPLAQSPPATSSQRLRSSRTSTPSSRRRRFERAFWGVLVRSVGRDETLYAMNAGKLMMPASTMKVVTLAAAAEKLGWDFTYETRLFASGPIDGGSLHGDLLVVGSGDPSIDDWDGKAAQLFADWAAQLKSAGISRDRRPDRRRRQRVRRRRPRAGMVVGRHRDELLGERERPAVQRGLRAADARPGHIRRRDGRRDGVTGLQRPHAEQPDYDGRRQARRPRSHGAASPAPPASNCAACCRSARGRFAETASVDNPTQYFVTALAPVARRERDRRAQGPAVDIDDLDLAPARAADPLITYQSPPLSTLATTMMRLSQNLYAETLLKTLGLNGGPGTAEAGRLAVRSVLAELEHRHRRRDSGRRLRAVALQPHHAGYDGRDSHARRPRRAPARPRSKRPCRSPAATARSRTG